MSQHLISWAATALICSLISLPATVSATAGATISLNLRHVPLHVALQTLADCRNLNLVFSGPAGAAVTMKLEGVPWEQALDILLYGRLLDKELRGNVLFIAPASIAGQGRVQPLEAKKQLARRYITIRHARAVELAELLLKGGQQGQGLLSKRGSVYVDERTNKILIRDEGERLAAIEEFVGQFDQEVQQVQIEARIVTITHTDLNQFGLRWGVRDVSHGGGGAVTTDNFALDMPGYSSFGGAVPQLIKISRRQLDLELSALSQENRVEIISRPRLLTADRTTASIKQGSEMPYEVTREKGVASVEFREAVLGLEATPYVAANGRIIIDLKISQNTPGVTVTMGQGKARSIDKQEIRTRVVVADGETVVLGGVLQRTDSQSRDQVPILGDLPIIGPLFGNRGRSATKRELAIFITPQLITRGCASPATNP